MLSAAPRQDTVIEMEDAQPLLAAQVIFEIGCLTFFFRSVISEKLSRQQNCQKHTQASGKPNGTKLLCDRKAKEIR